MRVQWQGVRTQVLFGSDTRLPAEVIAAAKLPEAVADAIAGIVKQTKLRRTEQCDVAAELCSHFAVGQKEGATPEQLLADFGEPRTVAKLIARAVKRKRGWLYHTRRRLLQGVGIVVAVLFVAYAVLFLRFHLSKPNIVRNYLAEYNAGVAAMPQTEVAWPIYRAVMTGWKQVPYDDHASLKMWPQIKPSDEGWPLGVAHVKANAGALATIRRAASLPGFGMPLSQSDDPILAASFASGASGNTAQATGAPAPAVAVPGVSDNPPLITVLLPAAGSMRNISRTIAFDAYEAAEAGDGERATENIIALLGIGRQLREPRLLIMDLVGHAITALGFVTLGELLAERPALFTDEQLVRLSHTMAKTDQMGNPFAVRFDFERRSFDDAMQRLYSDNGSGDGILVADGYKMFGTLQSGTDRPTEATLATTFTGPAAAGVMAGRRDMTERYHNMIDRAERSIQRPLWERTDADFESLETTSDLQRLRYSPVYMMMPALQRAILSGEVMLQKRDALLVATALELHHRRTGSYPALLSELTPRLLPTVPPDRFTGRTIGYVVKDGKPLLYSVGADRTDNGGAPPPGNLGSYVASEWMSPEHAA